MVKKKARRKVNRRTQPQDLPQPVIYKEIGQEAAEMLINQRFPRLYLIDTKGPHPNEDDSEATIIQGDSWIDMAFGYADQSVPENRAIWRGNLRRTALALAVQTWRNDKGLRRGPKLFAQDTVMMNRQRAWGSQNWGCHPRD